jgi:hypothetical protein
MNSIHRVGLTIATLATVATVAGSLVVQGYVSAEQAAAQAAAAPATVAAATDSQAPLIVYVNPMPTTPAVVPAVPAVPAVDALPAIPAQQPRVIHVIVPSTGGDDDGSDG